MDYEIMMNNNVRLGEQAPNFTSNSTTMGNISLDDYKGKWLVLFSYSGDFTPVYSYNLGKYRKCLELNKICNIDKLIKFYIQTMRIKTTNFNKKYFKIKK